MADTKEAEPGTVRLVIVDDHALLRQGTAQLLSQTPDMEVVGEAETGPAGLEVILEEHPDVALVDVHLPGMTGLELARSLKDASPETRVLLLSAYDDYAYVAEALDIGVGGYMLKTATATELVDAVRAVAAGVFVLDQALSDRLSRRLRPEPESEPVLTRREQEVLTILARGRSNQQIAAELGLGQRTVEGYVSSILGKLGVSSRAEAVVFALNHGLVELGD